MIDIDDLRDLDTSYFHIIKVTYYFVTLRSNNTGHVWHLLEQIANGHRTFSIQHRHHAPDPFHPQTNKPSIVACCNYIKSHDEKHLAREKKREERRQRKASQ